MIRRVLITSALLALTGCSSLFPQKEATRLFVLTAPRMQAVTAAPLPVSLQVMLPQANAVLDSERIALRLEGLEMSYFDGARWSGPLPRLVQAELVETFENQRAVASVGSDLVPFRADYALAVELRDFQAEYAGTDVVAHVRFTARLIDTESYNVIATFPYEETQKASANRLLDVVAAYNAALGRASTRLVQDMGSVMAHRTPHTP